MLRSSLCDFNDAYILVSSTITVPNTEAANTNNRINKIIRTCAPFTNCTREINNTYIDNAKDIDIVISMYNLIQYSDNYSKTSGIYDNTVKINDLWMIMVLLLNFLLIIITVLLLNLKQKLENDGTKNVKIRVLLKYLSTFWIDNSIANQEPTFTITDTKPFMFEL